MSDLHCIKYFGIIFLCFIHIKNINIKVPISNSVVKIMRKNSLGRFPSRVTGNRNQCWGKLGLEEELLGGNQPQSTLRSNQSRRKNDYGIRRLQLCLQNNHYLTRCANLY